MHIVNTTILSGGGDWGNRRALTELERELQAWTGRSAHNGLHQRHRLQQQKVGRGSGRCSRRILFGSDKTVASFLIGSGPLRCNADVSGLRVVRVGAKNVSHRWFSIRQVSDNLMRVSARARVDIRARECAHE